MRVAALRLVSVCGRRYSRNIDDVPATLRHYIPGVRIDFSTLSIEKIECASTEMSVWTNSLREYLAEYQRRRELMVSGTAIQGTLQAILMLEGLLSHACIAESSLRVLKKYKKVNLVGREPADLSQALLHLKPYYDGEKFIFDFDPPFYLLQQM
jgi:hypothetical protein